jgi:uncharacterized membrane protein YfcA
MSSSPADVEQTWWFLVLAGIGAGLCGSVAGLASLVSYPALLMTGLSPVVANVTNTTALLANAAGAGISSRRELRGQGRRLTVLAAQMTCGGLAGAALLLVAPPEVFAAVVPWLVALGSVLLLGRDRLRRAASRRSARRTRPSRSWPGHLAMVGVGVYGGYFGAGAGVILLAVLSLRSVETLAVSNAVKNVGMGMANLAAAVAYLLVGHVDVPVAALLGLGAFVGGWCGPRIVRWLPEGPLRAAVGICGLGLAVSLALG